MDRKENGHVWGVGIVGTGLIAHFHARAVAETPGARLVAVCGRNAARTAAFASTYGCEAVSSLEDLVCRSELDVLMIATPSGAHLDAAIAAARAGKHVLCEKPLEISRARIDTMIHAHREAGTRLGCIFQLRYMSALEPIRAALREGRFGTLTYAGAYVPWWRDAAYYHDSSWRGTWKGDGGGALMNQAIHMIDLLCDLLPPVISVSAHVSAVGHPGIETEDSAVASLGFEGGAVGVVYGTTAAWPGQAKRLEISGTDGTAVLTDDRLTRFSFREARDSDSSWVSHAPCETAAGAAQPGAMSHALHAACLGAFLESLQNGTPFAICGESARRPVALIEAIYEAARTGQTVRPNPD
ncbi:MAG TPA: Gfo/Idh/MocA family oxidoreductase [Kiritimatiellia bacterium]|jgi:predicted dehydrogenase|nr:Gfo/Idh/MocA family oxidoreductase [Kiritimatiellia bacterium]HOM59627.1 Gfo/Idh/MocA family oxidoreductase [Kiritimatiellia bacterium]HOR97353.1 Gfo/Idh/MocA family oxidoreductase [Kiritimatiellia bacterium]HPC49347.1 Gfo/Idh/MocA family oxidoreductase [Kiritimatiellia bacterium]HPW75113.1 Gfo/Idh/MocA family oxidoreductase [Kiritimatiellia bacterium]